MSADDPQHEDPKPGRLKWTILVLFGLALGLGAILGLWRSAAPVDPSGELPAPVLQGRVIAEEAADVGPDGSAPEEPLELGKIFGVVRGHDGTPLPKAQLRLTPRTTMPEGWPTGFVAEATTDARGGFSLGPVPMLEYRLEASAPGHAPSRLSRISPAPTPIQIRLSRGGGLQGLVVGPGGPVEDAEVTIAAPGFWPSVTLRTDVRGVFEAPPLPMGRYQVLVRKRGSGLSSMGALTEIDHGSGKPIRLQIEETPTTVLRVVDQTTGMPLGGALVTLAEDVVHVLSVSEWTDLDGIVEIYGVPEGSFALQVRAGGYLEQRQQLTLSQEPSEDLLEDDAIDIALAPAGTIRGLVMDSEGSPMSLVQITCHILTEEGAQWVMQRDITQQLDPLAAPEGDSQVSFEGAFGFFSEEDGFFEVSGLPPGNVILEARSQDYQPSYAGPFWLGPGGTLQGVELRLEPGFQIEGIVLDPTDNPVEDARIRIKPVRAPRLESADPSTRPLVPMLRSQISDEEGRFSSRDLPDLVTIHADAPGFIEASLQISLKDQDEPIVLRLQPPGDAISGRVTLEGELGLARALLKLVTDPKLSVSSRGRDCIAISDDDGNFVLTGCPSTPFWIMAAPFEPEVALDFILMTPGKDDVEIALQRATVLSVTVLDEADQPIPEVLVEATLPAPRKAPEWIAHSLRRSARTDAAGLALLEGGPPGTWNLSLSLEGWIAGQQQVKVALSDKDTHEVTVTLARARLIEGAVVDGYGAGVGGSLITVTMAGPGKQGPVKLTADAKGLWSVEVPHTGPLTIEALHPQMGRGDTRVAAGQAPEGDVTVTLTRANIDIDDWNKRLAPYGVTLWRDGNAIQILELDESGKGATSGLSRGDYLIDARVVDEMDGVVRLEIVRDDGVAAVTLRPEDQ